ncbi:MAG: carbohydrate porin [Gloeomargaritaceae cyanobacterium C42_A2020_066]|nr:carbohydrate porin [Gloeomargaritaceae cyanobacterium C42_A2020_066]
MNASLWKAVMVGPAALGAALLVNGLPAVAQMTTLDQIKDYTRQGAAQQQAQVTSVSEFSDVKPTDWAFLALQSLVERYGCIAGYPTNPPTFKGNRALTRYEFAAGLNACLDRINELIAAATEPLATKEELAKVQKLQEMFAAELATLRGRVDSLEARTATLEAQQFSTTTKLRGEVIFDVGGAAGSERALNSIQEAGGTARTEVQDNTFFGYRARLNFDTSFTGQDLLKTRLNMGDIPNLNTATGTNEGRLAFDSTTGGAVQIDRLFYEFPFDNRKGKVRIAALGGNLNEFYETYSPFNSSGNGAISRFGRFNQSFYRAGSVAGVGAMISYTFSPVFTLSASYLAPNGGTGGAADPDAGFLGSTSAATVLLDVKPVKNFKFGVGYARVYATGTDGSPSLVNLTNSTGTDYAADPFGAAQGTDIPTGANLINLGFQWDATPKFILSGWFGYTWSEALANAVSSTNTTRKGDTAETITAALQFGFPDPFGRKGDLGGIIVGLPPYVTSNDSGQIVRNNNQVRTVLRENNDTPIHIEGLYRFQINRNLRITPGFFVVINPEGNANNDAIWVYTVRSTFTF